MNRETLPYMTNEQFNSVAFVYRSKTGGIHVAGMLEAKGYEESGHYEHLATLDAHRWIEGLLRSSQKHRVEKIREILK